MATAITAMDTMTTVTVITTATRTMTNVTVITKAMGTTTMATAFRRGTLPRRRIGPWAKPMGKQGQSRDSEMSWWRLWPELFEAEKAAFASYDARTKIMFERDGFLILDVEWPYDGRLIRVEVGYSPFHPSFPPVVTSRELSFPRHQDPVSGTLCLLTQGTGEWSPSQPVAELIHQQLRKIFDAVEARREGRWKDAAQFEEQAPDPISSHYHHLGALGSAVFFDGEQRIPPVTSGIATFDVQGRSAPSGSFAAVLRTLEPGDGGAWFATPYQLVGSTGEWAQVPGRWVRLEPPRTYNVNEIIAAAEREIEKSAALKPELLKRMNAAATADFTITALLFREELEYGPGGLGNGWLFLASGGNPRRTSLVRGFRMANDLQVRVPVASALQRKTALLIGAGAIGSFAAVELARAGIGKLLILDYDVVEPGNSVRWPLGQPAWGTPKPLALKEFIETNYPSTRVAALHMRIGETTSDPSEAKKALRNPVAQLRQWIKEVDIVVDASASIECEETVAYHCRELRKPCVVGYSTEGAAGGVVVRLSTDGPACLACLYEHWKDGILPKPTLDSKGTITPIGCNAPTFTGAAFDLQELSLEVVRSTVGLLAPELYPRGEWDLAVLKLMDGERRSFPQWEVADLTNHPRCPQCGDR